MSTLQARLDRIRARFAEQAPGEAKAVMARATQDLVDSRILDRLPAVGDTLPEFSLEDEGGRVLHSRELLHDGPLVVSVYRGVW